MRNLSARAVFVCLFALFPLCGRAQAPPDTIPAAAKPAAPSLKHSLAAENEIGFFGTIPAAEASYRATAYDREYYIFGISYNRLLVHSHICDVRWVSEIMPLEVLREPFLKGTSTQMLYAAPSLTEEKYTYGMGSNPVGAEIFFLPRRKVQPFVGSHGGFSYFTRNILSTQASQFNFLLDGRAGLRYSLGGRRAVSVAYRFQHVSNAYIAIDNPGLDSQMIHISYSFPFHFGRWH